MSRSESESDMEEEEPAQILKEVSPTEVDVVCKLCFRPAQESDSGLRLGTLYSYGYCVAHLHCLMFSSGLNQNGEDEEGINGFLRDDIVKEWRRGSKLNCTYCKKKYATVGCVGKGCKKTYHLSCGLENGSLQQFFGSFPSFCHAHRPVQAPVAKILQKNLNNSKNGQEECGVCLEDLEAKPSSSVLWTPCCGGWFHRSCVERMAETAGCHFFKCPLCNNSKEFSEEMQQFGIYLPDQDAQWEAGDAFDDQLQRHDSCDAEECVCPDGRNYDDEDTPWEIMLCVCCGAQGIHIECGNLDLTRPRWKCGFCKTIVANLPNKPIPVFTRVKRSLDPPNKDFSRKVLENLSFKIGENLDIKVDMFRNRKNPRENKVISFQISGMPVLDIPNPVKLRKDVSEHPEDKIKNIPCPFDDCHELVSRQQFKAHCKKHREEGSDSDQAAEEKENLATCNKSEGSNTDLNQVPEEVKPLGDILELVSPTPNTKKSEVTTPTSGPPRKKRRMESSASKLNLSSSGEKQSSILNFFQKFSPKVIHDNKSPQKPTKIETSPSSPSLRPVLSSVNSLGLKTPEKKIITSPIGYFKVDEEVSIRTPVKNSEDVRTSEEVIAIDEDVEMVCDVCKESFSDQTSLDRHKSLHKTKFVCHYCKIQFTNVLSWKTHENSHKGLNHKCPICEEKFSTEKSLVKHRESKHMGRESDEKVGGPLRMFFCDHCDFSSKWRGSIKKHTKVKHIDKYDSTSEVSEMSPAEILSSLPHVVVKSPPEVDEIVDIDEDPDETNSLVSNSKVDQLMNEWD